MRSKFLTLICGLALSAGALAQVAGGKTNSLGLPIDPALLNQLPQVPGVVAWSVLAQVKAVPEGKRVVPQFAPAVRALDQQTVLLQGFMVPLVTAEQHDYFLLTMRPPHCPFCMSLGPEYIVEVRTRKPIRYSFEPIVLEGRFAVLKDDPFGLYYRLAAAQLVASPRP